MKKNRLKKYFANRNFTLGFIMVSILFLLMVVGFFYLPADPNKIDVLKELLPPSRENLLGTDQLGRDILSRVMVGSRISFFIGFCVVLCGGLLGCTLGGAAGYYGGKIDSIITKIIDTQIGLSGRAAGIDVDCSIWKQCSEPDFGTECYVRATFCQNVPKRLFKVPQQRICKGSKGKRCIRSENYDSSHLSKSSSGAVGYCNIEFFRSDHVGSWT